MKMKRTLLIMKMLFITFIVRRPHRIQIQIMFTPTTILNIRSQS